MKRVLVFILFAGLLGAFVTSSWAVFSIVRDLPNPERISDRDVAESTKIYDRTGRVLLYEVHGEEKRTVIPLESVKKHVISATLAAEDIHFYRHKGIDWRGIARAFIKNLVKGDISQGGSTITQQLIKNSIFTKERTYTRKFKEAILAIVMEKKYSKEKILELYLNQIPYGSNAYGIEAAAETFFAKDAKDLSISESALLAALPKAPTYYSPYGLHKEDLKIRRNWILERMAESEFISKEEATGAEKEPIDVAPPKQQSIRAPHFVMYVRSYLNDVYGEGFVEKGGLKVITTLDWELQEIAESAVREGSKRNEELVQAANASLVAIDPKTGDIVSMVGSRDYWGSPIPDGCDPGINCRFDPYTNATISARQPGSAFKPFVYATAFKKGYTPDTVLFDVPTEFNPLCNPDGTAGPHIKNPEDECYHPQNYDNTFRGPVTLRQAIAQSLNVPSVKLLYLAGVKESIETAKSMGISTLGSPERYGLTLVLGGAEVSLLEMTSSFSAFSQDGIRHPHNAILRIENSDGITLEEKKESSIPVVDTEIARVINDVLSDNNARIPVFNPRSSLYFEDYDVAVKSGTTQDYRDAWVIGYTPTIAAGVWVGNNNNTPMNQGGLSVMVAGPIWHTFLEAALRKSPPEQFIPPERKKSDNPVLRGLYRTGEIVPIDSISKKLATVYTPPELIEEIRTGEVKTIVSLIDKNNVFGPPPEHPEETEPQHKNWQASINAWLKEHPISETTLPSEKDDIHTPEKKPKILVIDALYETEDALKVKTKVEHLFPLREIILSIDDELVDSRISPAQVHEITFAISHHLKKGEHVIKITVFDAVGNKETGEKRIRIE
ncbi:MAG: penicillin-binding protein [Candidatus Colwellbacteria bacterium]|nr:penicillin-binding protein [Candidatus Colwellbacteria bacterium]